MRVRVKICGITDDRALDAAVQAGADAVGFVFAESVRRIAPVDARALANRLPPFVSAVAVTRHPDDAFLREVLPTLGFPWWQTDIEDLDGVVLPPGLETLPVLREGGALPEPMPGRFVYEGPVSGAGETVDWTTAASIARGGHMVLAGGLSPDNVAEAVRSVRPWAVDVSSGVEDAPGKKEPSRIRAFIAAVREAETTMTMENES